MAEVEKGLEMNIDGMLGAGLLASFRVTLVDGGRTMWLEAYPTSETSAAPSGPSAPAGSSSGPVDPPETTEPPPKASAPPKAASPSKAPKPGAASAPK
jgi:hypothetical protein